MASFSLLLRSLSVHFFPNRAGAFLPAANSWGKDGQSVKIKGLEGRASGGTKAGECGVKRNSLFFPQLRSFEMINLLVCFVFSVFPPLNVASV